MEELTTVTYHFADGSKQISGINKEAFFDEKGRKRSRQQLESIFHDTMLDLGAISFEI